jgi:hypothetical protein
MSDSHTNPTNPTGSGRFLFPRWVNMAAPLLAVMVLGGMLYAPTLFALGASPMATAVGYQPIQPVPYSHALHAGKLGMDCRYCHYTVEKTAFAAIPPTQTCRNCHGVGNSPTDIGVLNTSEKLKPIRDSWTTGKPVQWIKVHNLPNYVYFNHAAHVTHGVGCIECHGRIDRMDVVTQVKPLSMGWCVDCHRAPESHLRPREVAPTDMNWKAPIDETDALDLGKKLQADYRIHDAAYMTSCYTCHR